MIRVEQKILRLDVAVNDALLMRMTEARAYLLDVSEAVLETYFLPPNKLLEVAAGHVFENEIVEYHSVQVAGGAVADPADDIGVPHAVESDGLVLKIFYKRALKIGVELVLKE